MTFQSTLALVALLSAVPAQANQASTAPSALPTDIGADAICLLALDRFGTVAEDPTFMGTSHDQAVATLREATVFFVGRMTLRYEGASLQQALSRVDRNVIESRWMGEGGRCIRQFVDEARILADETSRAEDTARAVAGTPPAADLPGSSNVNVRCLVVSHIMSSGIQRQGAQAPQGMIEMLTRLRAHSIFYSSRIIAEVPAEIRGAAIASASNHFRNEEGVSLFRQCTAVFNAEMARAAAATSA
jgi:hypothetical protein